MKRIGVFLLSLVLVLSLTACGGESDGETGESKAEKEVVYKVGDTWTVDDQWKFTITSVETTTERNEFEESNPEQVILIKYSYENLGYEDSTGLMDGLYMDIDSIGQLLDSDGNVCTSYPLGDEYAQETPVGAKCSAEGCFGLKAKGAPVKLNLSTYDGNLDEQKATFELEF